MARFAHSYVLNVVAHDRPGIVAAVTGAIVELGGNVEACSQTVVAGYFTLIMIVSLPEPVEPGELAGRVRGDGRRQDFDVIARDFRPAPARDEPRAGGHFVMTAFGKDAPGVLNTFSRYLAAKDINIVDFYSDIRGEELVLISQLEVPVHWDIPMLQADLEQIAGRIGFTVRLQHENIFVATNQLRLVRP